MSKYLLGVWTVIFLPTSVMFSSTEKLHLFLQMNVKTASANASFCAEKLTHRTMSETPKKANLLFAFLCRISPCFNRHHLCSVLSLLPGWMRWCSSLAWRMKSASRQSTITSCASPATGTQLRSPWSSLEHKVLPYFWCTEYVLSRHYFLQMELNIYRDGLNIVFTPSRLFSACRHCCLAKLIYLMFLAVQVFIKTHKWVTVKFIVE